MEVWEKNIGYTLFKNYVDRVVKHCYRRYEVSGKENIPGDGLVIFAPNHCNTLMDALVMLTTARIGAFGARADMFRTPFLTRLMTFFRIVPIPRIRDGAEALKGSHNIIDRIVACLGHGVPFYLYSEGTHRPKRSLLPIRKGIFRIALEAMSKSDKPVYVVPCGIEYSDYFRFRSTLLISFGGPINVNEVVAQSEGCTDAEINRKLTEMLREGIANLITYLPDDENYEGRWAAVKFLAAGKEGTPLENLRRNKEIIASLDDSRLEEALECERERKRLGISVRSLGYAHQKRRTLLRSLLWLLELPYFIFCAIAAIPSWVPALIIGRGIKDRAFINTVRFGCRLVGAQLMVFIWAPVLFINLHWAIAAAILLLMLPSVSYFYDFLEFSRVLRSDIKLARTPDFKVFK